MNTYKLIVNDSINGYSLDLIEVYQENYKTNVIQTNINNGNEGDIRREFLRILGLITMTQKVGIKCFELKKFNIQSKYMYAVFEPINNILEYIDKV